MILDNLKNFLQSSLLRMKSRDINYKKWVFSSSFNTQYNYNSKYLFEYIRRNYGEEIEARYVINDDQKREELTNQYGPYFIDTRTLEGKEEVLSAGVWFTSAGLPIYGIGLKKQYVIINLWHGVPLKKIALKENHLNLGVKLYFKKIFSENYSYIVTTSSKLIAIMAESFGVEDRYVKVWGQPRNDLFFMNKKEIDLSSKKKIILYAPTFRDNGKTILFPFADMDYDDLNEWLKKENIKIFIHMHQSEQEELQKIYQNSEIVLDNSDEIMETLCNSDLLITDYSSIYIDFLITQKPILFIPYDKDEYETMRGFNWDYEKITPGPKVDSYCEWKKEIKKLLEDKEYYKVEREKCNLFFNEVQEESCKLIYEKIKECLQISGKI